MTDDKTLEKIRQFAEFQCSMEEIAAAIDVSTSDFEELLKEDINVKAAIEYGYNFGKCSIRRKQFEIMEGGSPEMAKWLGKQYLGQADKVEQATELSTKDDEGITINFFSSDSDTNEA